MSLPKRTQAILFLLLNTAIWGFGIPIIKHSLGFTSPATFLLNRYLIATLLFLPFFLIHRQKKNQKPLPLTRLVVLSILGTPLTLLPLFTGLYLTSSIEASIIESSSPIFTVILSMIILHEVVKKREWLGIAIALFGTLFLAIEPMFQSSTTNSLHFTGNLLIILSNTLWAIFLVLSKKLRVDPIDLSFFSFSLSLPFFLVTCLVQGESLIPNIPALPGIAYMAIGGSIIAFWAYQKGQNLIEASEASLFSYLKPLFSIPLSFLWLGETISVFTVFSILTIATGVYLSEKR